MIEAITVNELIYILQKEAEKGNGDMPIIFDGSEWEMEIYGKLEYHDEKSRRWLEDCLPQKCFILS